MIPGDDSDMFETFLKPSSHLGLEKLGRNTGRWNVIDKSPRYILLAAVPVNVHKENHLSIVQKVTKHALGKENRRMHLAAGFIP